MKKLLLILLTVLLMLPAAMRAQGLEDYAFSTGTDATKWITLTNPTSIVSTYYDDQAFSLCPIGFNFTFGENVYSQFSTNSNGNFRLGSIATTASNYSSPFSSSNASSNAPKIVGIGRDLGTGSNGYIKYELTGTAPNRIFVCEFAMGYTYGSNRQGDVKWQIQLHEGTNNVMIVYGPTVPTTTPSSFQIGMSIDASNVITINPNTHTMSMGVSSSTYDTWPGSNRYYLFSAPNITCPNVRGVTASNITDNSAEIKWMANEEVSSYEVYYTPSVLDIPDSTTIPMMTVMDDTSALLSNLYDNTLYYAYVRANCGETDGVSRWKATSFRTLCSPANLPYTENFDVYGGTGSDVFPPCWSKVSGTAYISPTAYSEPGALYLSGSSMAASQAIATEITSTMVSFRAKASSSSYKLIVGVISDPADDSTFVPVDTIIPINTNWIQYDIPLTESTLGGSNVSVAFKTTGTYYVDDVVVNVAACPRPTAVQVSDIEGNQVKLSWQTYADVDSWMVKYEAGEESVTVPASENPFILSGLQSQTEYKVYVASVCGGIQGEFSADAVTFTTTQVLATLPYTCTFDEELEQSEWSFVNGSCTNRWMIGEGANYGDGSNALYISNNNADNEYDINASSIVWAYRDIKFDMPGLFYDFAFDWKCEGQNGEAGKIDYFACYVGPVKDVTYSKNYTLTPPASATRLFEGNAQSDWQHFEMTSTTSQTTTLRNYGTVRLYFVWANNSSKGTQPAVAIDNITVAPNNCGTPTTITVDNITESSATVKWVAFETENMAWEVAYATSTSELETAEPIFVEDTTLNLENLTPATTYYLRVRTICGGTDTTEWSSTKTFKTECGAFMAPFAHSFTSSTTPDCWGKKQGLAADIFAGEDFTSETTSYWSFSSGYARVNIFGEEGSNDRKEWLITPMIDLSTVNNPELTFDVWISSYYNEDPAPDDKFMVIISEDGGATWSQSNATIWSNDGTGDYVYDSITTTHRTYAIPLSDYTASPVKIAFYGESTVENGDRFLDINNIKVGVPEGCEVPENVTVDNVTVSSATITWNNIENVSWEVAYATSMQELATAEPQPAADTVFELTGLTSATTYYVHVRTVCEGDLRTAWSSVKNFITPCDGAMSLPFAEGFEGGAMPACWSQENVTGSTNFTITSSPTNPSYTHSGSYVAKFYQGGRGNVTNLYLPVLDLSTVANAALSFWHTQAQWVSDIDNLSVYYRASSTDEWTMLETYTNNINSWQEENITLPNPSATYEIMFKATSDFGYGIMLDDIAVFSCAAPTDVAASDVAETEATISWTGTATSYNLRYKTATDEEWIEELSGVTSPYPLTGLTEATPYLFEVQAVCGAGDTSTWVGGVFTTAGGDVPQTCDLTIKLYSSDPYGGWYDDYFYPKYLELYINGEYYGDVTLDDGEYSATIPFSINTGDVLTLDWYSYYGEPSGYESYKIYNGDELLFEGDAYNYDEFTYTCNTSSCANTVFDLHTTDVTTNSISIEWQDTVASVWVVEYAPVGAAEPVVVTGHNTTSLDIVNLEVATDYVINVKADCGDEQSIPTTLTVKTDCELTAIPYTEDFEEYNAVSYSSTGKLPNCWDAYASSTTTSYKPKVATSGSYSFAQSGNKSMTFYTSGNASAVLPAMTEALNTLELGFWYKNYSSTSGQLIVGYVTEADSALNTFTAIDTLENTTTGQQVYYTLDNLTDDAYRIAFKYTTTNTSYTASVDDITLNYIPACAAPSNIATAPASNSITISVEDGADLYEVVYSTVADFDPDLATAVQINNPGDIYNLEPETRYYMYLRTVCDGSPSRWSDIFNDMTASANIAEVPYTCNFEDETENEGWTLLNGTAVNRWFIGEATGNPDHSLYISKDGGTTNAYTNTASANVWAYRDVRFPESTGYPYTLSFDWKSKGETSANDYVKVFIGNLATVTPNTSSTAASAPQGATLVGTFYNQDTWQHVEFDLSDAAYSNTTKRIYILWRNNTSAGVDPSGAIDNIAIDYNTCPMPTALRTTYVGGEVVTIAWNQEATDQSNWEVQWKLASDSVWNAPVPVLDANTYTITDLTGTTAYQARVRAICDGETTESNWTEPLNFTTDCVPVVAPWTEPFDSSSTLPQCWNIYSGLAENVFNGTSDLTPATGYWTTNTNAVLTGRHMTINIWGSSIKHWMVTPTIDMSQLSHPMLTFDLALTKYNSTDPIADPTAQVDDRFIVAVSTDNGATWNRANATEWNNDGTGAYSFNNIATTGETILVDLAQYEGQEIKIAFYGESTVSGNGDNHLHIDNVTVDEAPSCIWPIALRTTATTSSSITLAWDAFEDITAWNVEYKLASDTSWEAAQTETVTGMPTVELTGLNSSTAYTIRVQTDCYSDTSRWVELTAWTACGEMTITYTEDFESYASNNEARCWTEMNGSARVSISYPCSGSKSLKFSGTTNNMVAMPAFDREISELELSFSTRPESFTNSSCGSFQVGYVTDLTNPSSFVAIETYAYNDFTDCQNIDVTFTNAPAGSYIAFRQFDCSTAWYWFIDDIDVHEIPTCVRPTNLTASNATVNTVDLAWTENGDANNWYIEYGPAGFTQGQGTTDSASTNPFTLTGLDAATQYDFYVRADCGGDGVSRWSAKCSFTTECDAIALPYVQNFDSYNGTAYDNEGVAPTCWLSTTNSSAYPAPHITNGGLYSYPHSNPNALTFTGSSPSTDAYAVLPEFTSDLNTIELAFAYKMESTSYGTLTVGYVTDIDSISTSFQTVATLTSVTSISLDTVSFAEVPAGTTGRLAFHWNYVGSSFYSCAIDDISVYESSPVGTCDAPTNLQVSEITANSATVAWNAGGSETSWEVQYKAQSSTSWQQATVQDTTYTMEGLTPETAYEVKVKAICSDDNQSDFVTTTFTTNPVGIDNVELANSISLMPNPADNYVVLTVNGNIMVKEAVIYNAFGQMIQAVQLTDNHARINLDNYASGMYFVRVSGDNAVATKKFIKK